MIYAKGTDKNFISLCKCSRMIFEALIIQYGVFLGGLIFFVLGAYGKYMLTMKKKLVLKCFLLLFQRVNIRKNRS